MSVNRGDVALAWYPFASGTGGSRRPVLIIQNDQDNQQMTNTIVAQITTNISRSGEPTQLLIDIGTPDGALTGLLHDSVISCNNLATIEQTRINRVIGSLSAPLLSQVDLCLKVALGLP